MEVPWSDLLTVIVWIVCVDSSKRRLNNSAAWLFKSSFPKKNRPLPKSRKSRLREPRSRGDGRYSAVRLRGPRAAQCLSNALRKAGALTNLKAQEGRVILCRRPPKIMRGCLTGKPLLPAQGRVMPHRFGALDRQACPKCAGDMHVSRRTPAPEHESTHELQTFTCAKCGYERTRIVDEDGVELV